MKNNAINPWLWIPTLYFAEGIPYFIVNTISVIMFNNMGMPKGEMALYTSMLYLPWVIKPLWSPFVDIIKTKRWWVVTMQVLMSAAFALLALTLPHPSPDVTATGGAHVSMFAVTLILFWISAFASATHDIAADGFYMLALEPGDQSLFVGIRSTFYRLSSIFGQGILVMVAGLLETRFGDIPKAWSVTLLAGSLLFAVITIWHIFRLPRPVSDVSRSTGGTQDFKSIVMEFGRTFVTFFKKKGVVLALIFMLLYRLPEAFLVKMMNP
jgi:PAT family beta-lactamase induction signal transducer AmpG